MAHFTVEQVRDLAIAYFNGRDTYRKYNDDWFNGGEDLFYGTTEVEIDGQKVVMESYKLIPLEEAISLYANDEDECYYNETMNEDIPDFFVMMGDVFHCDEVYYDWDKQCSCFLNPDYFRAIVEPWHNIIGASIIDSITREYNYYAKGYNASC